CVANLTNSSLLYSLWLPSPPTIGLPVQCTKTGGNGDPILIRRTWTFTCNLKEKSKPSQCILSFLFQRRRLEERSSYTGEGKEVHCVLFSDSTFLEEYPYCGYTNLHSHQQCIFCSSSVKNRNLFFFFKHGLC
uniref:Uncharacterized protein n=1 Tax=Sus scrofa TaxID=9823 RepID=A0A8D1FQF2_PIG